MKVIHFIASIDKTWGGTTAYMKSLAEELNGKLEIIIASGNSENPVSFQHVKIHFFNTKLSRWFLLKKEFEKFLEIENPDLVHINGIWDPENWLFQKIAQKMGVKVIISPHGMLEPYILNRHPLKKKLALLLYQKKALKNADFFHATATSEKKNIQRLGFKQEIVEIPNGIQLEDFIVTIPKKSNPKKLLFLSRIHPKKGIEFLIEAWSLLDNSLKKNWVVEIIGNGEKDYVQSLIGEIKKTNISSEISILSPVFGVEKINKFRESSIFVLPTHSENFGIVIAEALASYTPVITTTGTPWEELNSHNCGWWISVGTEALKCCLEEALIKSDDELSIMGNNGRKLVSERYSIRGVGKAMLEFYKAI